MPDGFLQLEIDGAEPTAWHHHPTSIRGLLNVEGHQAVLIESESIVLVRPNRQNAGCLVRMASPDG